MNAAGTPKIFISYYRVHHKRRHGTRFHTVTALCVFGEGITAVDGVAVSAMGDLCVGCVFRAPFAVLSCIKRGLMLCYRKPTGHKLESLGSTTRSDNYHELTKHNGGWKEQEVYVCNVVSMR